MSATLEVKKSGINRIVSGKGATTQILKHQNGLTSKKIIVSKDLKTELRKKIQILQGDIPKNTSKTDKVLECGPLESMFPCSESKILDFLIAFQEYDYSISDISKNSGVGFKTTLGVIKDLESRLIILKERNVGRAKMFKINLESPEASTVNKLALEIATKRAIEQANQTQ